MSEGGEKPIEIEGLSKKEEKERENVPPYAVAKDPNFPADWIDKDIPAKMKRGYKYYRQTKLDGKVYMSLRGKHKDKAVGLGAWSEEREGKLFHFFPDLEIMGGIVPAVWQPDATTVPMTTPHGGAPRGAQHSFLGMDIKRVAVIPREYVPSLDVIRYYQIMRENGYPGDFSMFVNDIIHTHFRKCNGIKLPIMLEEEMEIVREDEQNVENPPNTPRR